MSATRKAYRSAILHSVGDPAEVGLEASCEYYPDGLLVVDEGRISALGHASDLLPTLDADIDVVHYQDALITPGFIDTHIHFPQTGMIGSYGEQLLDWLNTYTFPCEKQFADKAHADKVAKIFLQELLRNGTTTALVFGTVHKQSVDSLFSAAQQLDMRLIAGKVMMDRNAPEYLTETPEESYQHTRELIERWHQRGRLSYALTPRFAPTSSPELLDKVRQLREEFPDVWMHTHLSENPQEIAWVKALFPERAGYLDVYHHHQLTGKRSVFAHCLHLEDQEWQCLHDTDSSIAFCPTSNLFLGSGLFNIKRCWQQGVRMGIGTDVGAGTTFNLLQTLGEAYKVGQLQQYKLSACEAFYHATLGGAHALDLDDVIGNFNPGKEADFVVLDAAVSPLQKLRNANSKDIWERLFVMMTLGDDRNIAQTWVSGKPVWQRESEEQIA